MTPHTTHFDDCGCQTQRLRDLLAVIHQDGGHHTEAIGVEDAVKDAAKVVLNLRAEVARLREQKKYAADECVRLSNENERLRSGIRKALSPDVTADFAWSFLESLLKGADDA